MRIEELHLKNFRCFKELDIQFPKSNLAVFIGLNGAGKSAVLDAITSMFLALTIARTSVTSDTTKGIPLFDTDILIETDRVESSIKVNTDLLDIHSWNIFKDRTQSVKINDIDDYLMLKNLNFAFIHYTCARKKISPEKNKFHLEISNNFESFKKWFVNEKAKENNEREEKLDFTLTSSLLNVIRKSIETFLENTLKISVSNLRVKYNQNNPEIWVTWGNKDLNIYQLSDGQRNLLLLVSDIAFSLIGDETCNENEDDVLGRKGVVLIDEIELHLHPQWQREVLPALQKTFPNIQFIVTTHSPQVLSNLKKEEVFILKDNKIVEVTPHIEGRDSNSILSELFGVEERPKHYKEKLEKFYALLEDDEQREQAKEILAKLTEAFGEQDSEIVRANLYLDFASE